MMHWIKTTDAELTFIGEPINPLVPRSAYYVGPPPADAAYGTDPVGRIGVHHPREIVRVERDYSGGELPQFAPSYPLELEGRVSPFHIWTLFVLVRFFVGEAQVQFSHDVVTSCKGYR